MRGRDIKKYHADFADQFIIATFPSRRYGISDYPSIEKYLREFGYERLCQAGQKIIVDGKEIKSRKKTNNKWFETQDSISYWDDFSKPKLVWKRIGSKLRFSYDEYGFFSLDSTCLATGNHIKYLAGVLNTSIGRYLFSESPRTGTGDLIVSVQAFEPARVVLPDEEQEKTVESLTDILLHETEDRPSYERAEKKLDDYVCGLYKLSDDEIKHIRALV